MTAAVELSEEQLQLLRDLTNENDNAAALRTAVAEYIRYAKQMRLKELSEQIDMRDDATADRSTNGVHPTDAWMDQVEAIAAQGNPEDDVRLEAAIEAIRQQQKQAARKKLGLEP